MKIILLSITLFATTSTFSAESYQIAYQRGQVEIFRNNKLISQGPVLAGDLIKTGKNAFLLLKAPDESIKILENSIVTPTQQKEATVLLLKRGSLVNKVHKKPFRVRTPMATFGVRGTSFFVHAGEKKESWMCVEEGVVLAASKKGDEVAVPAGKGVFVKDKSVSTPRPFAWTKN